MPAGQRQGERLQRSRTADGRYYSKLGLYVRGKQKVTIIGESADVAIQGWVADGAANVTRRSVTLRLQQCGERWRVFPGGPVFARPQCAAIRVTVGAQSKRVWFGLGQDCPDKR